MKTRLPLLLLLALTLVALPALAQRDLGPGSPGQPKKPSADKAKLDAVRDASEKLRSLPDLTCAIEVYDGSGKAIQNGGSTTSYSRAKISAILHGSTPVNNVKLTYNWSRNGIWARPSHKPYSHTFASIAHGTVDAPPFQFDKEIYAGEKVKIVATIDADGTVAELNENNNTCSFEFQYLWPYPLEGD